MLTQSRLKELLTYDALTGIFSWALNLPNGKHIGDVAGWKHPDGYLKITIDGKGYYSHRLALLFVDGSMPAIADHRNGNRSDNSYGNIRRADSFTNAQNIRTAKSDNSSGFLGVRKKGKKFEAQIRHNKQMSYLGRFNTAEEAHSEYLKAKRLLHEGCTI